MKLVIELNPETTITRIDDLIRAIKRDFRDVVAETRLDVTEE